MTLDQETLNALEANNRELRERVTELEQQLAQCQQARADLQPYQSSYQALIEALPHGVEEIDLAGTITFVNTAYCALFGCTPEHNAQPTVSRVLTAEDIRLLQQTSVPGNSHGPPSLTRVRQVPTEDGRLIDVQIDWSYRYDSSGQAVGIVSVITDQTTHRQMEEQLTILQALVENAPDTISIARLDRTIMYANPAFRNLTGYGEALIGMSARDLYAEPPERLKQMFDILADQGTWHGVLSYRRRDGGTFQAEVSTFVVRDAAGQPQAMAGIARDITEQLQMEEALRHSQHLLQSFIEYSPAAMFIKDLQGRYLLANQYIASLLHTTPQQLEGHRDEEFFPVDIVAQWQQHDQQVIREGHPIEREQLVPHGNELHTYLEVKFPIYDGQGVITAVGSVATDITDRQRAQQALQESEERYRQLVEVSPLAILVHSGSIIVLINPAGARLFGAGHANQIVGRPVTDLLHSDSHQFAHEFINPTDPAGATFTEEQFIRLDGTTLYVEVASVLISYNHQPATQVVIHDVTQRKKVEEDLERSLSLLRAAFEATDNGIASYDPAGHLVTSNPQFLQMWQIPQHDFDDGTDTERLDFLADQVTEPSLFQERFTIISQQPEREGYEVFELRDGRIFECFTRPQRLGDTIIGRVWSCRDITSYRRVEEALRLSEARSRAILNAIPDLMFRVSRDGMILDYQVEHQNQLLMPPEQFLGKRISEIMPLEVAEQAVQFLEQAFQTGEVQIFEYAILFPDGMRQFETRYVVIGSDEVLGMERDITERKRAEEDLRLAQFALDRSADGIAWLDPEGFVIRTNDAACQALGYERSELIGMNVQQLYPYMSPEEWQQRWEPFKRRGSVQLEIQPRHKDGNTFPAEVTANYLEFGGKEYVCCFARDVTERKQMEEMLREANEQLTTKVLELEHLRDQLREQAVRDALTGLFNRRYLESSLERELSRAKRLNTSVGVILLDIDHFKQYNTIYGLSGGDAALRAMGDFLKRAVRSEDIACRYGGEEFTLILPGASLEQTLQRAEEVREGIKQLQVEYNGQWFGTITASLGVSSFPEYGLTVNDVLAAADAALGRAKSQGRDRVVLAD